MEDNYTITTFYHFADLTDVETIVSNLKDFGNKHNLKGTILVAEEGVNATVSGGKNNIIALENLLLEDKRFSGIEFKRSYHYDQPFKRFKVRKKKEIITFKQPLKDINNNHGKYLNSREWNEVIKNEKPLIIDTRNNYEVEIGTFEGAVNPNTNHFSELPDWLDSNLHQDKQQKILMFCTGGVRCEKSTAYLKAKGFDEVYHLKGGIIKYLEETKAEDSLWHGKCYIFDERISLDNDLCAAKP